MTGGSISEIVEAKTTLTLVCEITLTGSAPWVKVQVLIRTLTTGGATNEWHCWDHNPCSHFHALHILPIRVAMLSKA